MTLTDWFANRKKSKNEIKLGDIPLTDKEVKKLWKKCNYCEKSILTKELKKNIFVCPFCDYHFRIGAKERIYHLLDENTFEEINAHIKPSNPLDFHDTMPYLERQEEALKKTGLNEAIITGYGYINGYQVGFGAMDFSYMGGSMGSVVGEKTTRLIEGCLEKKIPLITITSTGGARMQEGILSLMQMAKTSCALARMHEEKLLYISILAEPTFGGVTASYGTLGDILIAEKDARIGFAGRRVIEQTIRQKLPSDFQTAQYLFKFGQVDMISHRKDLKETLYTLLNLHSPEKIYPQKKKVETMAGN
ncbi:MAG: acetyl-CoA carboxylase, carboxyltransferase subunit beta [Cyanobacteriota bacterium]